LFTGKAFLGAGQYFAINLQPGIEFSQYEVTFREPYLLDTDYFFDTSAYYKTRIFNDYSDERIGTIFSVGQRFGDVWSASVQFRAEQVRISNVQDGAPLDVWNVEGDSDVTSAGFVIDRNTTDSGVFPTRGNLMEIKYSHDGALGGNFDFDSIGAAFSQYWTLDEDFFERKNILHFRTSITQLFDGSVPVFERLYAGGERSFRGFAYYGVSPRGNSGYINQSPTGPKLPTATVPHSGQTLYVSSQGSEPVGGSFMWVNSLEYSVPIFSDILRGVVFSDFGTVQSYTGIDQPRVSVGVGMRLKIPFLGSAPFALDLAVPVVKQKGDQTQFFGFNLDVPFL
jgi:outer membrane protein insertion porin family